MTISIIIPVYNAQEFLKPCLDSVLQQSYRDFELLLIDDGSTDQSLAICRDYATADHRIQVYHKENGGVSSARNLGLDKSKGHWIAFIDSDDIITESYISDLLTQSESMAFVYQSSWRKNINTKVADDFIVFSDQLLSVEDFFKSYFVAQYGYVWGKVFKRAIIDALKLRFAEDLSMGEDNLFILGYLQLVDYIRLSSTKNYFYLERENSLVKKKYSYRQELSLLNRTRAGLHALFLCQQMDQKNAPKELQYLLDRVVRALYDGSELHTRHELKALYQTYHAVFKIGYKCESTTGRAYLVSLAILIGNTYLLDQIFSKLIH